MMIKDNILELFSKGGSLVKWRSLDFDARPHLDSDSTTFWLHGFQDSFF